MKDGVIVMGGRFLLFPKNAGKPEAKSKAQVFAQGYDDKEKSMHEQDTTVLRSPFVCLLRSAAALHKFRIFSHDVPQAYL